jgi:hypothetical protein
LETIHLSLHNAEPVTGHEDGLSALFYEYYRGIPSREMPKECTASMGHSGRGAPYDSTWKALYAREVDEMPPSWYTCSSTGVKQERQAIAGYVSPAEEQHT